MSVTEILVILFFGANSLVITYLLMSIREEIIARR